MLQVILIILWGYVFLLVFLFPKSFLNCFLRKKRIRFENTPRRIFMLTFLSSFLGISTDEVQLHPLLATMKNVF